MARTTDFLTRAERQLGRLTMGAEQATLDRWRTACGELAVADDLSRPVQLGRWLRRRPASQADEVLRGLVRLAQRGDTVALLAVLVCLAPGIRTLARRTGISSDEAMSEVTLRVLEFPVERRRSVAGGLLLDARNRISRHARRIPQPVDDITAHADRSVEGTGGPVDPARGRTSAEQVLAVVCEARRREILNQADAQLIVDTRLGGQRVAPAAARLGIAREAAYQRRTRAERLLATAAI